MEFDVIFSLVFLFQANCERTQDLRLQMDKHANNKSRCLNGNDLKLNRKLLGFL